LALGLFLFAVGATLRPEVHLLVVLAAALAVWRARAPSARGPAALGLAASAALLALVHGLRWRMYGTLVPNTALVKTASVAWALGLRSLGELAATGLTGVLVALACWEARRKRDDVAVMAVAALFAFAAYIVRVGRDEMALGRLYLPVLPLAFALSVLPLADWPVRRARALVALVCATGLGFAAGHLGSVRNVAFGDRSYVRLAEALRARAQPGDLVVFQDLGRTPFEAMELRFVDPIGLVDREIATILHRDGSTPFVRPASDGAQAAIRDRLFARGPRFIAMVAYPERADRDEISRRFDAGERQTVLAPLLPFNSYNAGLPDDARFLEHFHFIDAWRRHDGYYLVLYEESEEP
jgi:hypothetical protein